MKTLGALFSDPYMAGGIACLLIGYALAAIVVIWESGDNHDA